MKKITFIYLLVFNFLLLSCTLNGVDNEVIIIESTPNNNDNISEKPAPTDLAIITQQLTNSYKLNFNDSGMSLSQKINLLDSAALYVPSFTTLKPVDFILPDVTEAYVYLNNHNTAYTTLNVSVNMKGYLDMIVQTSVSDYYLLLQAIQIDSLLTTNEKENLKFIIIYLQDTAPSLDGEPIDQSWKRRNIVAAIKGFEKSNANAVFNVALVSVVQ